MPADKDATPTMTNNLIETPTLTDASYADLVREMVEAELAAIDANSNDNQQQ